MASRVAPDATGIVRYKRVKSFNIERYLKKFYRTYKYAKRVNHNLWMSDERFSYGRAGHQILNEKGLGLCDMKFFVVEAMDYEWETLERVSKECEAKKKYQEKIDISDLPNMIGKPFNNIYL